jgi:hypothetical protein
MIVYHGGVCEIHRPDILHSNVSVDFGPAFYVTTFQIQAEKWALRKSLRLRKPPCVNEYELSEDWSGFKVLKFDSTDEPWFDFVCSCRMDGTEWQRYDIIMGRVANDDVYLTINKFLDGEMTKAAALAELRYAKPNDQIAINSQGALDSLLVFKRAYEPEVRNAESSI